MATRYQERKASELDPRATPDIAARLDEGERLSEAGELEKAEIIFRDILSSYPNHSRACNDLTCVLWQNRRHEEALEFLDKAIQQDPDNIDAVWNLGQILRTIGRDRKARSVYRDYLKRHPDEVELMDEMLAWQRAKENPVN